MKRTAWLLGAVLGWAGVTGAGAQVPAAEVEERVGAEEEAPVPPVDVQLRGGVSDYTGNLGERTDVGPLFGVTVGARRYPFLGMEFGYEGTQNKVSEDFAAGGDEGAVWRHNGSALLKAGPDLEEFLPFVGAGVGLSYVNVTDAAERNDFVDNDFILELPFAAGLEYRIEGLTAGVRGTYRVLFDEDFAEDTAAGDAGGNALSGSLTLGGAF